MDFFHKVTHSLSDLLSQLTIRVRKKIDSKYQLFSLYDQYVHNDAKNYSNQLYMPLLEEQWVVQNHLPFGRCYTFHVPKWLKILQVCQIDKNKLLRYLIKSIYQYKVF